MIRSPHCPEAGLTSVLALAATLLVAASACEPAPPDDLPDADAPPPELTEPGPLAADTFEEVVERGTGEIVVLYVPSGGFAYRDDDGELTGVTVEILRDFRDFVEREHEVDLELTFMEDPDWARFYERVRDSRGGVFGIGNVTITEERRGELAFSPSYLTNVAVLITHEDTPELGSLDEIGETFGGLTGASFTGTLHEERLRQIREEYWPEMPTDEVHSNDELMERVSSGDGYFAWVDVYNYWRAAEDLPLRRHPVGDDASEDFGVIMPRRSDWVPVIEAFFQQDNGYRSTARYGELLETHLGSELAESLEAARNEREGG